MRKPSKRFLEEKVKKIDFYDESVVDPEYDEYVIGKMYEFQK